MVTNPILSGKTAQMRFIAKPYLMTSFALVAVSSTQDTDMPYIDKKSHF